MTSVANAMRILSGCWTRQDCLDRLSEKLPMPENKIKSYNDFTYGSPGAAKGLRHAWTVTQGSAFPYQGKLKILVVGSGNGYELVHFVNAGHEVTGLEMYVPDIPIVKKHTVKGNATSMPFADKQFDLVFSCEVLEHVPMKCVDAILSECKRVADYFYFTVATIDDPPYYEHVTIKPGLWWCNKFDKAGLDIMIAQIAPKLTLNFGKNVFQTVLYRDGVMIYGRC